MEIPCDCGEPQAEFEDAVCRVFESEGSRYEILDRNIISDPFEPDLTVMDDNEWVFNVVCYYIDEIPYDRHLVIFPRTFGMRKWIQDSDECPAFFILGVGGVPSHPDMLFLCRFFNVHSREMDIDDLQCYSINCFDIRFLDSVITRELDCVYSPL